MLKAIKTETPLAGYSIYKAHTTDMIHSGEGGTSALLSLYGSQSSLSTQFGSNKPDFDFTQVGH